MSVSQATWKAVVIIPKVGGSFSCIGSCFIWRDIMRKWREKKSVPLTSKILFCISIADTFNSFFISFLSTWMVPKESGAYLASGSTESCVVQGFIANLVSSVSVTYYTELSILYWIIVRFGWTEDFMRTRKIRLSFLLPPTIIALASSIPPIFTESYNYSGIYSCYLSPYPLGCDVNPDVDCIRGANARNFEKESFAILMFFNFIIIIFVSLLVHSIFKQERKTDKYLPKGQARNRTNTLKAAWQGIRFTSAFTAAYFSLYLFLGYSVIGEMPPLAVFYLHVIFHPLLGFFNSFAYFRPKYLSHREKNEGKSRFSCLCHILGLNLDSWFFRTRDTGRHVVDNGEVAGPLLEDRDADFASALGENHYGLSEDGSLV